MKLLTHIIRAAAPLPSLEICERFLFVGPHPDDIEIGAGATVAKLAAAGKQICFLVCTDGRYGFDHAPADISTPEVLAQLRKEEALRSATMLGVTDVRFGNLSDGAFYTREELSAVILRTISDFQPDVVFCPDPSVTSECHGDHLNVGEETKRAACFAPNAKIMERHGLRAVPVRSVAFYMTAKPNQYIGTDGYLQKQLDAIFLCHKTQFPKESSVEKSIRLYLI